MTTEPTIPATDLATTRRQLIEIRALHASGVLSGPSYEASCAMLERRILDLVMTSDAPQRDVNLPATAVAPVRDKMPIKLLAGLGVAALAVAAAGYLGFGTPPTQIAADPVAGAELASAGKPHATGFDQIAAMTEKLSARLKENPADSEGWAMLARSYTVLGRNADALDAFEKANALRGNDAVLLADYADALALKNNRVLAGEPMKMVEQALKLDPQNLKALSLAGTGAFEAKNYSAAVKYWEQMVQIGPSTDRLVEQILPGLAQARELAGLPPSAKLVTLTIAQPAVPGKSVSGTVRLSPALADKAAPDDTVYVIARPGDGSRMPLAILQKKVRDLPLQFTLDDSMAMSPDAGISRAGKVVVVARVSKSGNAMPQKGDLSGQSGTVDVGASAVAVDISEAVK